MATSNFRDHLIDEAIINQLTGNYQLKNYVSINAGRLPTKPDSKEFVFDFDVLKDYLDFVKAEAQSKGYSNLKIVIKMGQYPDGAVISPMQKPNTLGYQTVCLVPEYQSSGTGSGAKISGLNYSGLRPPD